MAPKKKINIEETALELAMNEIKRLRQEISDLAIRLKESEDRKNEFFTEIEELKDKIKLYEKQQRPLEDPSSTDSSTASASSDDGKASTKAHPSRSRVINRQGHLV